MTREEHALPARAVIAKAKYLSQDKALTGIVRFTIACPPNFENARMFWAVRMNAVRDARDATMWAIRAAGAYPTAHQRLLMATEPRKRVVSFVRYFGGRVRQMDAGGMVSACKPVLDAMKLVVGHKKQYGRMVEIQGAGLIHDDSPEWVTTLYEQKKDKDRAGQLQVEVSG